MHRALEQLLVGNGSHNQADADYWLVMGDEEADAAGLPDSWARLQRELSPPRVKAKQEQQQQQQRSRRRSPSKIVSMPSPLHRAACAHEDAAADSTPGTPTGKAKKKGLLSKIVSWGGHGHHSSEDSDVLGDQAEEKGKRPLMVSEGRQCGMHEAKGMQPNAEMQPPTCVSC